MPNRKQFKTQEDYLDWYRKYRKENRKEIGLYSKKYMKKYRRKNEYEYDRKYYKENPEKSKARCLVYYAIKCRYLKKQPCEICGSKKSQAHHDDYSKPLEVRWLCSSCHKKLHNSIKKTVDKVRV